MLPLREVNFFGLFVDPAAPLLLICIAIFFVARLLVGGWIDVDRYVWHRPLFEIALFAILFCVAMLTLRQP